MTTETQAFIEAEKQADRNVAKACELLVVSRSAFYDRLDHVPSAREVSDAEVMEKIKAIHALSGGTYGAPRILYELREEGWHVGKKRVARLMTQAGLAGRCRRRSRRTTFADPEARALNLLARNFGPENLSLDTTWAGDITYVRTWEGWAYLATVIDLASRRLVGWAMADHMDASLVCDAMNMALAARRPAPGLLFHSDRGSQYTSVDFRALLAEHHVVQSLSRRAAVLGQRRIRKLVRDLQTRAHRGTLLAEHRHAALGHLRLDRGLVQHTPPPFDPWRDQSGQLREEPSTHRRSSGIINLSGEPGQSHTRKRYSRSSRRMGCRNGHNR